MTNNTHDTAVKKEEQNSSIVIHPSRYRTLLGRNNQSTGSHLYSFTDDDEFIVNDVIQMITDA